MNNFEYVNPDGSGDPKGLFCPVGAHIRRINPRGQPISGQGQPGGSNNTHRLVRRGLPYGPAYDPTKPYDGIERGLMGYFINTHIENQYEFVLGQWVNASEFAGAVRLNPRAKDPLIGTQDPEESIFVIPQAAGALRSRSRVFPASRPLRRRPIASCRASPQSSSSPAWPDKR